jgi:hypothetical protein
MPDIKCNVLTVLDSAEYNTRKVQLRIVEWEYDTKEGRKTSILLEKRELYQNEDGSDKMGKAKGLSLQDFEKIVHQKDVILPFLRGEMQAEKKEVDESQKAF